ncbi:MAG: CcmD family protein [bacterium]
MKVNVTVFLLILLCAPLTVKAQGAKLVHYQGVLMNSDDTPFNGATNLTFSIYTRPLAEQPIWSETHENVEVKDGAYGVFLGSHEPLNLSYYEYFLEVKADAVEPPRPKVSIVGSGYNFRLWFLFAAYTVVWFALFGYIFSISRRQKKMIAELQLLAKAKSLS